MPELKNARMTWAEAKKAFVNRKLLSAEEFYALEEELRGMAFTITNIASQQQLYRVKRKLEQIIAEGETLAFFREWLAEESVVWNKAYSHLVFRQSVFGAYNSARYDSIMDPDIAPEFPYLRYEAVMDERTREDHAALHGRVWARHNFPEEYWPPNGFACRCDVVTISEGTRKKLRATPERKSIPTDKAGNTLQPDEGWRVNQNAPGYQPANLRHILRETITANGR
jgi:SPP1 gp7 family putative phage head morphogenesis protein